MGSAAALLDLLELEERPRASAARPDRTTPNASLVERLDLTPSVARFRVRLDLAVPLVEPGQYLTLGLPVGGRTTERPYSPVTGGRGLGELEFLIRLVGGGALTPRLWRLRPRARLRVGHPKGRLRITPGDRRAHLLVATGTGLAPLVAMAPSLAAGDVHSRAVIVHGVSHRTELAYRDRLERWSAARPGLAYEPVVSRPAAPENAGWTGRTGRIDDVLDAVWRDHGFEAGDTVAYLCGNPEMVASVGRRLAARGVAPDAIRSERYWTSGVA